MTNILFPEAGYTPANLVYALKCIGYTRDEFAQRMGVTPRVVYRWLRPIDKQDHRPMPARKWLEVMAMIEEKKGAA